MKEIVHRITSKTPKPMMPPAMALRKVTSKSGKGVYASTDTLFKGAVFGRDSLEVAEDLLTIKPRLARKILLTLARLQGEVKNDVNEEEPGKIIHEYRTISVDGRHIKGVSLQIFTELAKRWGGNDKEMAYYGSIDSTPHFVRLALKYCSVHSPRLLREKIVLRSGKEITFKQAIGNSLEWLMLKLDESESGLLEYQRRNPIGIENQVWKDSREFYVHENGEFANHKNPIVSIEVQGLVYDALSMAGAIFPDKAEAHRAAADKVRARTLELLWLPERNYFALGLDYDEKMRPRIIMTSTANPAALLDSSFFSDLPAKEVQKYVTAIISKVMSQDFLTDAGIRSRALSAAKLLPYWDYHGSYVTWPKETRDIAKGLRRQGFLLLAKELENRLLNVILRARNYTEFIYVDDWGRVMAGPPTHAEHGNMTIIDSTNNPESVQAWTVSAIMAIVSTRVNHRLALVKTDQTEWQERLERQILAQIPRMKKMLGPWTLAAKYPSYPYKVVKGKSNISTDMPAR